MSIPPIALCGKCGSNYAETGDHQPYVFDCGDGACGSCVSEMRDFAVANAKSFDCHRCNAQIKASVPDWYLIGQISYASQRMAQLAADHEENRLPFRDLLLEKRLFKGLYRIERLEAAERESPEALQLERSRLQEESSSGDGPFF